MKSLRKYSGHILFWTVLAFVSLFTIRVEYSLYLYDHAGKCQSPATVSKRCITSMPGEITRRHIEHDRDGNELDVLIVETATGTTRVARYHIPGELGPQSPVVVETWNAQLIAITDDAGHRAQNLSGDLHGLRIIVLRIMVGLLVVAIVAVFVRHPAALLHKISQSTVSTVLAMVLVFAVVGLIIVLPLFIVAHAAVNMGLW